MNDISRSMVTLTPILSRISAISSAVQKVGGPSFKTARNPQGIVALLDFAKSSADRAIQSSYKDLISYGNKEALRHLTELGHNTSEARVSVETPAQKGPGERFYRGAKLGSSEKEKSEESKPAKKTKTIKTVYRGQVTYKEVPID